MRISPCAPSRLPPTGHTLLTFALGPVQPVIAAARTVRDLWAGSYLLSWLTREAMTPAAEAGEVLVPSLEGAELALRSPCFPNRFTASVPVERAHELASACEASRAVGRDPAAGVEAGRV